MDNTLNYIDFKDLISKTKEKFPFEDIVFLIALLNKIDMNSANEPVEITKQEICDIYGEEWSIEEIKDKLKEIADVSLMVETKTGSKKLFRWLEDVTFHIDNQLFEIEFDEELIPCFLQFSLAIFRTSF